METVIFIVLVSGILGYLIYSTITQKSKKKDIGGPIDPGNGGGGSVDEIKPDDKTRIED